MIIMMRLYVLLVALVGAASALTPEDTGIVLDTPDYLMDYACKILDSDDNVVDQDDEMCPGDCTVGPLDVSDEDDANYEVYFCDKMKKDRRDKEDVRRKFCSFSVNGEVKEERICFEGNCTLGPLRSEKGQKTMDYMLCDGKYPHGKGEGREGKKGRANKRNNWTGRSWKNGGQRSLPHPLERIACEVSEESVTTTRSCPAGRTCSVGPLTLRVELDRTLAMKFCTQDAETTELGLADLACRVRTDDNTTLARPCPCHQVCTHSLLSHTAYVNGTSVAATLGFCHPVTKEERDQTKAEAQERRREMKERREQRKTEMGAKLAERKAERAAERQVRIEERREAKREERRANNDGTGRGKGDRNGKRNGRNNGEGRGKGNRRNRNNDEEVVKYNTGGTGSGNDTNIVLI